MAGSVLRTVGVMGGYHAARSLTSGTPRVLAYHRLAATTAARAVGVTEFRQQMLLLKRHFNVVSMDELCEAVRRGQSLRNAVVITFDDAYEDFYRFAFPVLHELSLPATLYVPTDFVAGAIWMWPDRLRWALGASCAGVVAVQLSGEDRPRQLPIGNETQREFAWGVLADGALLLQAQQRDEFIAQLAGSLRVSIPEVPTADYRAVSWQQLQQMHAAGLTVGSHTRSHVRLAIESRERQWLEISESKCELEARLRTPVRHFCYPHGGRADYTQQTRTLVEAAGYDSAVVAFSDGEPLGDRYSLRRYTLDASLREFEHVIHGWRYLRARLSAWRAALT
jgi:peptidoglycan/xylan/chitin deacetylase (PgdA/CDA1 family)